MTKRTMIIAEAGVNHNGNLNLAKKLIDAAASSGADVVKFQNYKTFSRCQGAFEICEFFSKQNSALLICK